MHFTATFIATSAAVSGALASYYEEPVYYTSEEAVYTSIKTCTESSAYGGYGAPTSEAVYAPTSEPVYAPAPTSYAAPTEVTYTSYALVTVTSCADYVTNCPAATYTSAIYSVSSCTGEYGAPSSVPYYVPPVNTTACYGYDCPASTPVYYPTETAVYPTETPVYTTPCTTETAVYPTETPTYYTNTYYTTVCPGKDYCYATTVTSTYCPGPSTVVTYVPQSPTYTPVPPPVYTTAPSCPGGYGCPTTPVNQTTPVYTPPPVQTGAASANAVSFGVAVIAGLAALFIAA
jgi:hypothetical protein